MFDVAKSIKALEPFRNYVFGDKEDKVAVGDIVDLLKTQEPVEPITKNKVYFCKL